MTLREVWDRQAEEWTRFVRDPRGDVANPVYNLPRLLELVPNPGRATLDLGCGEGRAARALTRLGHRVVGVDSSPGMVRAACETGVAAVVGDAAALPFGDGEFDLVVAFMSIQDMDDLDGAMAQAARVLERGGRLCMAVPHPVASCGRFASHEPDAPFVVAGSYMARRRYDDVLERDGFRISFSAEHRPLSAYSAALSRAGFLIDALREPRASDEMTALRPTYRRWQRIPLFLHLRAVVR